MVNIMKITHIILVVFLSAVTAFAVGHYMPSNQTVAAPAKETAFQRVMRTNVLRCSYVVIPPELNNDPNTGAFSGVAYDIMAQIAKRLNLEVQWTEEVNFGTVAQGLKAGRYDAFCLTTYRWAPSARVMEYTDPLFYTTTNAYVRVGDDRFDANLKAINDPNVRVATIDGEAASFIRMQDFPKSQAYSMPQSTDISLLLETVANKKADVTFSNPLVVMGYLAAHADVIKMVKTTKPIRIHSHAFAFDKGEHDLTSMFNVLVDELHQDGTMDRILDKYESIPDSFVRIKKVAL